MKNVCEDRAVIWDLAVAPCLAPGTESQVGLGTCRFVVVDTQKSEQRTTLLLLHWVLWLVADLVVRGSDVEIGAR